MSPYSLCCGTTTPLSLLPVAFTIFNIMPAPPRRAAKSQAIHAAAPKSRAPPPSLPGTVPPTLSAVTAGKRPASFMTPSVVGRQTGKRPRPPSNEEPRNNSTTPGAALRPPPRSVSPAAGFPASNTRMDPPIPAVSITSYSLGSERIGSSLPALSSSSSYRYVPSSLPLPPSELGSVASMTGCRGPRSSLHSGDMATASVLETFKRLLQRYCYKVSPFISPGEDMLEVSVRRYSRRCVDLSC